MKRPNSEDSSLELLLDTMCNTFGGVMFIAISLAVMVSLRSAFSANVTDNTERLERLKQEMKVLQARFEQRSKEQEELERRALEMSSDPRMRLVKEIAFLERKLKENELKRQMLDKARTLARTELENTKIKVKKISDSLQKAEKEESRLKRDREKLDDELKDLMRKLRGSSPREMVFHMLMSSKKDP